MRLQIFIACATCLIFSTCQADTVKSWNWGADAEQKNQTADQTEAEPRQDLLSAEQIPEESEQLIFLQPEQLYNDTNPQSIVDEILQNGRQGRNLKEYDEVYTDPGIVEALQKGDDSQARNLIKERLCSLGLMDCGGHNVDPKRPYVSPDDLIYAQPVALKPIGQPIASIPVKGPRRGVYGPPKPMPYPSHYNGPSRPQSGPPRRGYGPPPPPGVKPHLTGGSFGSGSFSGGSFGSSSFSGSSGIYEGPLPPPSFSNKPFSEHYKPIEVDQPYDFVNGGPGPFLHKDKQPIELGGAASTLTASTVGVQQHVHHHFHHGENAADGKLPTVVVNNPIPVKTGFVEIAGPLLSGSSQQSSNFGGYKGQASFSGSTGVLNSGSSGSYGGLGSGSLSGVNSGVNSGLGAFSSLYTNQNQNVKPISENVGPQTFGQGNTVYGQPQGGYYGAGSGSFGTSVGNYGNSGPFYKKELNVNKGVLSGNSLQSVYSQAGYADRYQGFESGRAENYDCVCVPFNQCPASDVLGRKDDLFLAIDPRNLKSDIQAIPDDQVVITDGNGTMTVVRVSKNQTEGSTDIKKVSKREAPTEKKSDGKSSAEPRVNGYLDDDNEKKIRPTFGVSFGLPNQGIGGYPLNPFGPNPVVNPYGSVVGGSGINLGLVSVNPLISVQVTRDDYGKKIIKPLVNLHVTPNDYLVHKFENLLYHKKQALFNKHEHYHHHHGHPRPPRPYYGHHSFPTPHYGFPHSSEPIIYGKPHLHGPPFAGPTGPDYYPGGPEFSRPPPGVYHEEHPHHHHGGSYPDDDFLPTYGGGFGFGDAYFRRNVYGNNQTVPGQFVPQQYAAGGLRYGADYNDYSHSNSPASGVENNGLNISPQQYVVNGQYSVQEQGVDQFRAQNPIGGQNVQNFGFTDPNNPSFSDQYTIRGGKSLYTDSGHSFDKIDSASSSNPSDSFPLQQSSNKIKFPTSRRRRRRDTVTPRSSYDANIPTTRIEKRQGFNNNVNQCGPRHVCCKRPNRPLVPLPGGNGNNKQCGTRHSKGINGRIKNPVYVDGDSEFGEYPWQAAILKKDSQESVYVCGGTLIDDLHVITAAHCVKTYHGFDLRVRLGEWDVNHDVEFYPYIERDVISVHVHPEFYAGTLYNDLAILKLEKPVDWARSPHISPACLPDQYTDYTGTRCWTTGWGKDAFGDFGKYQNILKEVDVPVVNQQQCQQQMQNTRLGYDFKLHPGFICAGGEEGKDACKGDGGGPMVCERGGTWQVVGVVSWGIGCGQYGVPGVYVRVAHYLDWIKQITQRY